LPLSSVDVFAAKRIAASESGVRAVGDFQVLLLKASGFEGPSWKERSSCSHRHQLNGPRANVYDRRRRG